MSRNNRASVRTKQAGSVSPAEKLAAAASADRTSRSSMLPADPPARRVRAIQPTAHVAASHDSQRSRCEDTTAASSRHSPMAASTNAMRWESRPPR